MDGLLYSYMLGLGEFDTEPYDEDGHQWVLWMYFITATYVI